ncbi:MAG: efflux RND transporter periplasmic adaptor subunit [Kangiellaceae bacterium]|jgi:RND family efflux transporter MFP subunit|nr:efflux RND transporter periplasmic adaptor subunit [Kangiellaceae bacterium]
MFNDIRHSHGAIKLVSKAAMGSLITLAIAAAVLSNKGFSSQTNEQKRAKLSVSSQRIELRQSYQIERYFSAQVQPQQRVAIASELAGKVEQVAVDDGDKVSKGDLLFKLDTQLLEQQQLALNAQKKSVEADLLLAKKRLQRQTNLKQSDYSADDTIDELNALIDRLNASILNLDAQIRDIDLRIEKSSVFAPFNGRIQLRYIDTGAVINAGSRAFDLVDDQQLEILAGLPKQLIPSVQLGNVYNFTTETRSFTAKALAVLPEIETTTQTQLVKFSVNQDQALTIGNYIRLALPTEVAQPGFWLANSALIEGQRGLWEIFVIDDNERVQKQSVSIIYPSNPNSFVRANIADGSRVVTEGVHRLANNVVVSEQVESANDQVSQRGSK